MKTYVYGVWCALGVVVAMALIKEASKGDITWWLVGCIYVWCFLCGLWSYLSAEEGTGRRK